MVESLKIHCAVCGTTACEVKLKPVEVTIKCSNKKCNKLIEIEITENYDLITKAEKLRKKSIE